MHMVHLKKYITVALVLLVMPFSNTAKGQTTVDGPQTTEALKDRIGNLEKKLSISEASVKGRDKIISGLNEKIAKLELQNKELKGKKEITDRDNKINVLRQDSILLRDRIAKDSIKIVELNLLAKGLKGSLDSIKVELAALQMFKKDFALNLFRGSKEYLQFPYSRIESNRLDEMMAELEPYKADKDVQSAIKAIEDAKVYKGEMTAMEKVLSEPFDANAVKIARSKFTRFKSKRNKFSELQWEEFDLMDQYLSRYAPSVDAFQKIIKGINQVISQYGGYSSATAQKDCIEEIKVVFKPYEDREIKRGIMVIPYLTQRFDKYNKWVLSNPLTPSKDIQQIETEILTLKTGL